MDPIEKKHPIFVEEEHNMRTRQNIVSMIPRNPMAKPQSNGLERQSYNLVARETGDQSCKLDPLRLLGIWESRMDNLHISASEKHARDNIQDCEDTQEHVRDEEE